MSTRYKRIQFDLEKAKLITDGKLRGKIVTEKGLDVRIVCYDYRRESEKRIIALVNNKGIETLFEYHTDGTCVYVVNYGLNLYLEVPNFYKDYTNFEPCKWQVCLVRDGTEDVWRVRVCSGKSAIGDVIYYTANGGTETWLCAIPLNKWTQRLIGESCSYEEICIGLDTEYDEEEQ